MHFSHFEQNAGERAKLNGQIKIFKGISIYLITINLRGLIRNIYLNIIIINYIYLNIEF